MVWGHKPLVRIIDGQYYYYLYNGHGDVVQVVDENGNIVNSYKYDEWGNTLEEQESIQNPIRYAGEYYDEESGLYYLRARYYDPTVGRFITRDTYEGQLTNPLSMNQYTYCMNNPLIYVDSNGHEPIMNNNLYENLSNEEIVQTAKLTLDAMVTAYMLYIGVYEVKALIDGVRLSYMIRASSAAEAEAIALGEAASLEATAAKGIDKSGNQVVNMSEELLNKSVFEDGANLLEKVGNYKIYGNKGLVGNTYTRNVLLIETDANTTKSLSGFKTMVQQLENEAKAAGASKISIGGFEVYNKGFLSPAIANKMGYKMEIINDSTVILTKELK